MFYFVKQLKMGSHIRHSSKCRRNRNTPFIPWWLVICFPILKTIQQNLKISANLHHYHSTERKKNIFNLPEIGEGLSSSLELEVQALNRSASQIPI